MSHEGKLNCPRHLESLRRAANIAVARAILNNGGHKEHPVVLTVIANGFGHQLQAEKPLDARFMAETD